jgi:hypothetical protein
MTDDIIRKREMKRFLEDMKLNAHWLYALMRNSPKDAVWITRDDDWEETLEHLSIAEFEQRCDYFHPRNVTFSLSFKTYFFYEDREEHFTPLGIPEYGLTGEDVFECDSVFELQLPIIRREIPRFMAYVCRQEIMNGRRLEIDEAATAKYGFTQEDAEQLKYRIADINTRLLAEFRREYEWLKGIMEKEQHS